MKLSSNAIAGLRKRDLRLRLALALGFGERWVYKLAQANKPNGPLTTAGALQIIQEETGLTTEELLEETERVRM